MDVLGVMYGSLVPEAAGGGHVLMWHTVSRRRSWSCISNAVVRRCFSSALSCTQWYSVHHTKHSVRTVGRVLGSSQSHSGARVHHNLNSAPYILYGDKYFDLVSPTAGHGRIEPQDRRVDTVPASAQCQRQLRASVSTVPASAKCQRQHSASINPVPASAQCQRQHSASINPVPASAQCQRQHSASVSTVPADM